MLAHERSQVRSGELSEMLELDDVVRFWGLVEWEDTDGSELFVDQVIDPDNVYFFAKRIGDLWLDAAEEHRGVSLK